MQLVDEDRSVIGCFLDKNHFSVQWFHEKLTKLSIADSYQTEYVAPLFQIEYPILCFTGSMPSMHEICIVNLADDSSPITKLKL